jgi:hypothetical protein
MTSKILTSAVAGCAFLALSGCVTRFAPTGELQFQSYPDPVKIPLAVGIVIPQTSRDFTWSSGRSILEEWQTYVVGPLFSTNVPIALGRVFRTVGVSESTRPDIVVTAELTSFYWTGLYPVHCATVIYKVTLPDGRPVMSMTSSQSYKQPMGIREDGGELAKKLILMCLEDLNNQLLAQKPAIFSAVGRRSGY